MSVGDFAHHSRILTAMTVDFARAVPDEDWDFTPVAPGSSGRPAAPSRLGDGFAPFPKQLRHVVCVRGVYNDALETRTLDWSQKNRHHTGPLTREALLDSLDLQQRRLTSLLGTIDPRLPIDWGGFPYSFDLFAGEFVQHEAIHHGQWSVYSALAGFDDPLSWRESWGL